MLAFETATYVVEKKELTEYLYDVYIEWTKSDDAENYGFISFLVPCSVLIGKAFLISLFVWAYFLPTWFDILDKYISE